MDNQQYHLRLKKFIIVTFIIIGWQCSPSITKKEQQPIYIYDSIGLLDSTYVHDDLVDAPPDKPIKLIAFETSVSSPEYFDSILISNNRKIYILEHYFDYHNYKDTSFKKDISFLDSLEYFDNEWLKTEVHLDSLWAPIMCWRCSGIYDTAKIYLILPIENSDSLQFLQVHRWFRQTQ